MSGETAQTVGERVEKLREYDLERVNRQMRADDYENVEELEMKFRRLMKVVIENPDENIRPKPDVDEYWHKFILDTKNYHEFCDEVFGEYLHHVPDVPEKDDIE